MTSFKRSFVIGALTLPVAIGCATNPGPLREEPELIGRAADLYELPAAYQSGTYRHMNAVYPTRVVHRGDTVYPLPEFGEHGVSSLVYSLLSSTISACLRKVRSIDTSAIMASTCSDKLATL